MEAIILDMDGVLVDSEALHLAAANAVLARHGAALSEEENRAYLGMDDASVFAALKERFGLDAPAAALAAARAEEVIRLIRQGVVPQPGVPELVTGLKMRGIPMALASSSPAKVVEAMLEEIGLSRVFDAVVTGDDVAKGKPAPDIFLKAAAALGVAAEECLVVEDALHGVRAARAAGMTPVAVRTRDNAGVDFSEAARVLNGLERFDWGLVGER